jgi:hypothetical protein
LHSHRSGLAFLFLVVSLTLGSAGMRSGIAAPPSSTTYVATTPGGSAVRITTNAEGTAISSLILTGSPPACAGPVEARDLPILGNDFTGISGVVEDIQLPLTYAGSFGDAGAVAGYVSVGGPFPRSRCSQPAVTFTGSARGTQGLAGPGPTPGATYRGSLYQARGWLSRARPVGTITLTVSADGRSVERVSVGAAESYCSYRATFEHLMLTDSKLFDARIRFPAAPARFNEASIAGVVQGRTGFGGVIYHPVPVGQTENQFCGSLLTYWNATLVDTTAPAVSDAPAAFASAPEFTTDGYALAVFNGGSVAQLQAASAAVGATGAWVQDGTGGIVFIPTSIYNPLQRAIEARFPVGFRVATAITLVQ